MMDRWDIVSAILDARMRQIMKGYNAKHDDAHAASELRDAAGYYATDNQAWWPKDFGDPPGLDEDETKNLIVAASLLIAEAERLERAKGQSDGEDYLDDSAVSHS